MRPTEISKRTNMDATEMVWVPAGDFVMGSADFAIEGPVQTVHVDGFWIDKYPVSNRDFLEYVRATSAAWVPDWPKDGPADELLDHPVERISWHEARGYAEWCGKRLPTEAEWEKAARGVDGRTWPWGNELIEANLNIWDAAKPLDRMTVAIGSFPGNVSPFGCVDMVGNVEEWVEDLYQPYSGSKEVNPSTQAECRVLRGGSWFYTNEMSRCAFRRGALPTFTGYELAGGPGFRCARS
jgi:formylglycine-generating enzyme required for sulfatase activity